VLSWGSGGHWSNGHEVEDTSASIEWLGSVLTGCSELPDFEIPGDWCVHWLLRYALEFGHSCQSEQTTTTAAEEASAVWMLWDLSTRWSSSRVTTGRHFVSSTWGLPSRERLLQILSIPGHVVARNVVLARLLIGRPQDSSVASIISLPLWCLVVTWQR